MNLEEGMDPVVEMACGHEQDVVTGGCITDGGEGWFKVETACEEKCEHGVRKAKGDALAIYCSGCNPGFARIMAPAKRVPELQHRERTIDALEYLEAPVWERLVDAERMEAMCA